MISPLKTIPLILALCVPLLAFACSGGFVKSLGDMARLRKQIAEWFVDPVLTQNDDLILFDIKFNRDVQTTAEKRLQLEIHIAALSKDSARNISLIRPYIMALLEGTETFRRVHIQSELDNPR